MLSEMYQDTERISKSDTASLIESEVKPWVKPFSTFHHKPEKLDSGEQTHIAAIAPQGTFAQQFDAIMEELAENIPSKEISTKVAYLYPPDYLPGPPPVEISAEMDGPVMEWGNLIEQAARLGCELCEDHHNGWCLFARPGSMVNIEFLEGCPKHASGPGFSEFLGPEYV